MPRQWDPTVPAVLAAIVMLVGTVAATGGLGPGQWRAQLDDGQGLVRFDLRLGGEASPFRFSFDVASAEIEGFDPASFGRRGAPIRLAWKRDAGSFVFEGEGGRRPGGRVHFDPDAAFANGWREMGFGPLVEGDLVRMASHGVRIEDAQRLHELGYRDVDPDAMIRATLEPEIVAYAGEIHGLGLSPPLADLFRLHAFGVSVAEVRGFAASGLGLDVDGMIRLASRGIDAGYVAGVVAAGIGVDDPDDVVRLHAHGLAFEYALALRASGLPRIGVDEAVRLHAQGIDPSYVRELVESRLQGLSIDDVVRLHAHGVSSEFLRSLVASGRGDLSVDQAIRASTLGAASLDPPSAPEGTR